MNVFLQLADQIQNIKLGRPVLVGVSGITGCGKSTFCNDLAGELAKSGRKVTRTSIDHFHNPKSKRHERGRDSAEGYYLDSHNYGAFKERFLLPLNGVPPFRYSDSSHNLERDTPVTEQNHLADKNEIFIVDGTFLFKAELIDFWDFRIFLDTSFEVALERGVSRDSKILGGREKTALMYRNRYHAACQMYLSEHDPKSVADAVISNDSFTNRTCQL